MAIIDDFSISAVGAIRHTGGSTVYTMLAMHAHLQALATARTYSGDDVLSAIKKDPSKIDGLRSDIKPMSMNLLNGFNITDTEAQFLNFGSISQNGGADLWTGLKTIGTPLVPLSPIYLVQNGSKLPVYWPAGHIQVTVRAKTAGAFIDNGNIESFSRKYGQTYSNSAGNLIAGSEQILSISTAVTDWTTLTLSAALALAPKVALTFVQHSSDKGDGNGPKLYDGTITLSDGCRTSEAAQYLQAICDQDSVVTINGVPGWRYKQLNPAFAPNIAAPFGHVAAGKWLVAQGWDVVGATPADSQAYELTSNDGTKVRNPIRSGFTIGAVIADATVVSGRYDAVNEWFLEEEYTLAAATTIGSTTITVNEAIKIDTPESGVIRVNDIPHDYDSWAGSVFTLSGTAGVVHAQNSDAWVPFIDEVAIGTSVSSAPYTYNADFTALVVVKKGTTPNSKQTFVNTFVAGTSASNGVNAILNPDE